MKERHGNVWCGAVGAGDKGLYTVYMFQLTSCISKNIAVQLACAFAMKVRGCNICVMATPYDTHVIWLH